jgi:hypothetical protein
MSTILPFGMNLQEVNMTFIINIALAGPACKRGGTWLSGRCEGAY